MKQGIDRIITAIMCLLLLMLLGLLLVYRWYRQSQILEKLTDKYVFITGCDSGFGNLLARQLDKRGMKVLASCLTEKGAENLKKEASSRLQTTILDIADSKSVSSAAEWVSRIVGDKGKYETLLFDFVEAKISVRGDFNLILDWRLGDQPSLPPKHQLSSNGSLICAWMCGGFNNYRVGAFLLGLWGLVNNAGIAGELAPFGWLQKKDIVKVLDVNLLGMIDVTLTFLPLIRKAKGRIVNVSSIVGRLPIMSNGYNISKYGVEVFSDTLRQEVKNFGIKVSIIEPGAFSTNISNISLFKKNVEDRFQKLPAETKKVYGEQYLKKFVENLDQLVATSSHKIYLVTNCMEHALTACHPWTRYSAGLDAKLFYIPLSYFPTFIIDYILTRNGPKPAHGI